MPVVYCEMVCYGIVQSIMFLCLGAILWKLALPYNVVIVLARWEICHRDARFWFWLILLLIHLLHNGINCWTAMHRDTRIYIAKSCLLSRHRVELKQLMCMSGAVSTSCALVIVTVPCHSLKLRLVVWRDKAHWIKMTKVNSVWKGIQAMLLPMFKYSFSAETRKWWCSFNGHFPGQPG